MRLASQVVFSFFILIFILFQAPYAQNIQFIPIDTVGDVGAAAILRLDRADNPHIFYYDYTNNREKYAHLQDGNWHVENSFQRNDLGDFEIDSLENIHCSFGRERILEYGFIENDSLQISRLDSSWEWYTGPNIELIDGIPHIVGIQFLWYNLIEAYPRNNNWVMDTLCSLPIYSGYFTFKNYFGVKHAVYICGQDKSLIHAVWTSGTPTTEYIRRDSVYAYTSMDMDRDGNLWVAYEGENYGDGYHIFVSHKAGSEWQTEMLDTTYHGEIPCLRYSPYDNTVYVLFRIFQPIRKLVLCHKVDSNWEYEDLYYGPVSSARMEIDANGNIHIALCLNDSDGYGLYYGFINSPVGIDEARTNKPEKIGLSCYPNPFNSSTSIGYDLPKASDITFAIFDIVGRKVATLVDGHQTAGHHEVIWNASSYSSGIYFAKASSGGNVSTIKLIYLK